MTQNNLELEKIIEQLILSNKMDEEMFRQLGIHYQCKSNAQVLDLQEYLLNKKNGTTKR